ncbi:MAG TPA: hypothetical protein DDX29_11280 [Clostridiales bacterium]|nr:hypothetical protein [Clostridiales bacterium]
MLQILKKYLRTEFFLPKILIPLIALTLYSSLILIIINQYLYEVVNFYFNVLLLRTLVIIIIFLMIIHSGFFIIFNVIKGNKVVLENIREKFDLSELILAFLPLSPIIVYVLNNLDVLEIKETFMVLIFFILFSILFVNILPFLLGKFGSTKTMSSLGAAFAFTITSMPSLSQEFNWITIGDFKIQILFIVTSYFLIRLLIEKRTKKFLYVIILVNFLVSVITPILSKDFEFTETNYTTSNEKSDLISKVDGKSVSFTPNIYLLVYESYVPNETLLNYGIDNEQQQNYLSGKGFTIYPKTYSVGSPTIPSMSRVFNASPSYYGYIRRGISGDGIIHNILKKIGYKTVGVFPDNFMFQGVGSNYDYSYPEVREENLNEDKLLILTILSGEFRFKLGLKDLPPSHEQYIETKHSYFEKGFKEPIFLYTHSDLPGHAVTHGGCRPNEIELYKDDLLKANLEMKKDVNKIIENDPSSIIIVAGDHGPYLSNNCFTPLDNKDISDISRFDIQDRFATFLAIRWPTEDFERYDDIVVLQDLFPVVLSYIFNDEALLDTKIEPIILTTEKISGASVSNGIIQGGTEDGEPLFIDVN